MVALGSELIPDSRNPGVQRSQIAGVLEDKIGARSLLGIGHLESEPAARVGDGSGASFGGRMGAGDVARNLHLVWSSKYEDAVEAVPPICEHPLGFAAGASVALHLEDEGGLGNSDGGRVAGEDLVHPTLLSGDDGGVDDGVEVIEAAFPKDELGEAGAIEPAVGPDDLRAEGADDVVVDLVACSISSRPSSSASITWAPSSRSHAATVLLPLPRPPVRPTRSIA